jgi:ferredoxin
MARHSIGGGAAVLDYSHLAQAVDSMGLALRGAFHPTEADQVPDVADRRRTSTMALVGFVGKQNWRSFSMSPEAADRKAHPLDRWSRRVIDQLSGSLGANAIYPFPTDAPPYFPFQRWARAAEPVYESPIKILVHPDWGLWHGYRGALLFADHLDLPPRDLRPNPCDTCDAKPCLRACPVGAFEDGAYSVSRCVRHLDSPDGADCLQLGCRARRACPIGAGHRYAPAEAALHMRAFHSRRAPRGEPGGALQEQPGEVRRPRQVGFRDS